MTAGYPLDAPCPCGQGHQGREGALSFGNCCEPLLSGAKDAPTARALMQSRYTAFVLEDSEYLMRSWHPRTRPASLDLSPDMQWLGLEILQTTGGTMFSAEGTVEFNAYYEGGVQHEHSTFSRVDGRWVYVDALPS
ncbi:YchJ family protein [Corynebacterium kozikiae]|uniref:YchJ family protein n=1 Tax=Corynebacterium kozikiae TaxID=2968469 RepID=UPI00211CF40C|nr:YchJ family metal-binding protein [Corynebacterium sp. 76QC2CO]MCQ9343857.1 YchJ family metal-binding protein [Corynebacterium sp. 76QC2CO]